MNFNRCNYCFKKEKKNWYLMQIITKSKNFNITVRLNQTKHSHFIKMYT